VLTATSELLLPTTVTGSWPRPAWYTENLNGRPFSTAMADIAFREQFIDAISAVISDQEWAGLDIFTNGDYHLDADLGGRSWHAYPLQRLAGMSEFELEATSERWSYPTGTILNELMRGWRFPAVVGQVGPRIPLEFAKIWRVAQARSRRPIKFGTITADAPSTVLALNTDIYPDDKRQLMWDIATVINTELRALAAAGCTVIQIEDPIIHNQAALGADDSELDFLVDLFNYEVEGLDDTEIWIHTCWGNPGAQRGLDRSLSYEASIDIYLNRLNADVWTIESKDSDHAALTLFEPYKGKLTKKVAVGFVSHRTVQVETLEEVATDVRRALEFIDAEHLILTSDCGFGRQGVPRLVALYKAAALAQGANIVRRELGLPETEVPAADPLRQIDVSRSETSA
jgi:5-methyltetrahydropteroyltriglutamate--homocysteine methyltransferase